MLCVRHGGNGVIRSLRRIRKGIREIRATGRPELRRERPVEYIFRTRRAFPIITWGDGSRPTLIYRPTPLVPESGRPLPPRWREENLEIGMKTKSWRILASRVRRKDAPGS